MLDICLTQKAIKFKGVILPGYDFFGGECGGEIGEKRYNTSHDHVAKANSSFMDCNSILLSTSCLKERVFLVIACILKITLFLLLVHVGNLDS